MRWIKGQIGLSSDHSYWDKSIDTQFDQILAPQPYLLTKMSENVPFVTLTYLRNLILRLNYKL